MILLDKNISLINRKFCRQLCHKHQIILKKLLKIQYWSLLIRKYIISCYQKIYSQFYFEKFQHDFKTLIKKSCEFLQIINNTKFIYLDTGIFFWVNLKSKKFLK
ncbi:hypothetical protein BpHYR1_013493 [Brachionus plicatilis]|uniref:Uncharacterized protein n=1 Tax=Brachionus plicatilis TaxID=10195 RepID=A0A3M7RWR6_BRAPC|nr:hypothetical protein BpHYR1_013493 [Brachionus plicatilis]